MCRNISASISKSDDLNFVQLCGNLHGEILTHISHHLQQLPQASAYLNTEH